MRVRRRVSLDDALAHGFFDGMQRRAELKRAQSPVDVATIDFEKRDCRLPDLKALIVAEIRHHNTAAGKRKR